MRAALALILLAAPMQAQLPTPPVAKKLPVVTTLHGDRRVDDYAYFKDRTHPETIPYLEAENAYTEAMTAHTKELQQQLYDEMLGRIKEDDAQVPVPRDGWFYYSRTERGKAYPIFARKRGSLEAPEEIYFDQNREAEGHAFYQLGGMEVSPDHKRLAVLVDTNGYEDFSLRREGPQMTVSEASAQLGLLAGQQDALLHDAGLRTRRASGATGTPRTGRERVRDTDVLFNVASTARATDSGSSSRAARSRRKNGMSCRPTDPPRRCAPSRRGDPASSTRSRRGSASSTSSPTRTRRTSR
jgi:hypothetical protein